LGCKTVLLGSSYYRYPDTKAEPYVGVGAGRSARHEFDQEDIALSADAESISGMELPLEDLLDFDLSSPAPAKSSPGRVFRGY
jgi:hypothetical protein